MADPIGSSLKRWRYGIHPNATDTRITSLGRVHLQLGEALRLEMVSASLDADDTVHLQYYIATELGTWAVWLSCSPADLADCETSLRELSPPFAEGGEPGPKRVRLPHAMRSFGAR